MLGYLVHVRLDRGKVLLAELLHRIAHDLIWLEGAHALIHYAVGIEQRAACVVATTWRHIGGGGGTRDNNLALQEKRGLSG